MGYKQPRVPEYREEDGAYIRTLILFLKDFAAAAWSANNRRIRENREIREKLAALQAMLESGREA